MIDCEQTIGLLLCYYSTHAHLWSFKVHKGTHYPITQLHSYRYRDTRFTHTSFPRQNKELSMKGKDQPIKINASRLNTFLSHFTTEENHFYTLLCHRKYKPHTLLRIAPIRICISSSRGSFASNPYDRPRLRNKVSSAHIFP